MLGSSSPLVSVFGASGFLGRHVVRALAQRGYRIKAAMRRPDLAGYLQPLGDVGQIHAVQANLRHPASLKAALQGADAVINLVGILRPQGRQSFEAVQDKGVEALAEAAHQAGIKKFIQLSAIGADADSPSAYARSKAMGERAVQQAFAEAVIIRPSIVFGPEDQFFNRFAALGKMLPIVPIAGADTLFQPVYVGDVAETVARAVDGDIPLGRTYELGGPDIRSFRDLVAYALEQSGRKKPILALPKGLASLQAGMIEVLNAVTFGLMPDDLILTRDQVTLLERDNIVSDLAQAENRTLAGIGITPTSIEAIVPSYLVRFRPHGQFDVRSSHAPVNRP
jgi:uncharacterized protein YbjT (DUF2867 family)